MFCSTRIYALFSFSVNTKYLKIRVHFAGTQFSKGLRLLSGEQLQLFCELKAPELECRGRRLPPFGSLSAAGDACDAIFLLSCF